MSSLKRGTLILTIIAGILVFLGVLVLYLPASWFASMLPPQVRCTELGGSVWNGECVGMQFQGTPLGDAAWNLSPLRALTGKLSGDVELRGTMLNARADVDVGFDGAGELRNVGAQLPMDPALIPQFNRDYRGRIVANLQRLTLGANGTPQSLQGTLELHDFRQLRPQALALGSYQLVFDGTAQPTGASTGQLKDLGGPFALEGTLTFAPPNEYAVSGFITGRSAEAERIVREITLGAMPDASGRSAFAFEGTF